MGDFRQKKKMNKTFQNIASRDTWGTFAKVVINLNLNRNFVFTFLQIKFYDLQNLNYFIS